MKKVTYLFTVIVISTVLFTSCSKNTTAAPTMVGFWPGFFANTSTPQDYPNQQFSFLFRGDSTLRVYVAGTDTSSPGGIGLGTYSLAADDSLTIHFTFSGSPYSGIALVDTSRDFFQGTLGIGSATSGADVYFDYKK